MIELYQFESCPYCARVREVLSDLSLDWISRTATRGSDQRKKLIELGGKEQVPFLVDPEHNVHLYESEDIIAYLKKTYGNAPLVQHDDTMGERVCSIQPE